MTYTHKTMFRIANFVQDDRHVPVSLISFTVIVPSLFASQSMNALSTPILSIAHETTFGSDFSSSKTKTLFTSLPSNSLSILFTMFSFEYSQHPFATGKKNKSIHLILNILITEILHSFCTSFQ